MERPGVRGGVNDDSPKMSIETRILWTLVAVALVLFFAARVAEYENDLNGSYVVPTPTTNSTCVARCVP
jgi:hypothetical protein